METLNNFIKSDEESLFEIIGSSDESIDQLTSAPYSYWRETFKTLFKRKVTIICLAILVVIIFFTIFGPMFRYLDPSYYYAPTNSIAYLLPNATNWFGTSNRGFDIWSVMWKGSQLSLQIAVTVSLINAFLGLVIGSIWGFFPKVDPFLVEVRNFINNVPGLLINMMFMQFFRYNNVNTFAALIIVMTLFGWLGLASTLRNNIIIIRNRDFNIASKTLGSKPTAIITHNLLPYLVSIIVTILATAIPGAIDGEVSLAFFGLSYSYPTITLGSLISEVTSANSDWMRYPHVMLIPSSIIILMTVSFYYIGFALADATDPRQHR